MGFKTVIANYIANSPLTAELFDTTVTMQAGEDGPTYEDVTGLVDVPARKISIGRAPTSDNQRWALSIGATHVFQLKGYYPAITTDMRVVNDSEEFQMAGLRHPGELQTIMACWATNASA